MTHEGESLEPAESGKVNERAEEINEIERKQSELLDRLRTSESRTEYVGDEATKKFEELRDANNEWQESGVLSEISTGRDHANHVSDELQDYESELKQELSHKEELRRRLKELQEREKQLRTSGRGLAGDSTQ